MSEVSWTTKPARRGTSNANRRGSSEDRRRRREWLVKTYRADQDLMRVWFTSGGYEDLEFSPGVAALADHWEFVPSCRCYRCGRLLHVDTVTVDRIVPGCRGGTYRRSNIRPACGKCNSETGGATRR